MTNKCNSDNQQQTQATVSSTRARWAPLDRLTRLSCFHPLEATHTRFGRAALPVVLTRLTAALYRLDCHVEYDARRLVAQCDAMSNDGGDGVRFQVGLFWDTSRGDDSVILELQKRDGDSLVFYQQIAPELLQLAHAQRIENNSAPRSAAKMPLDRLVAPCSVAEVESAVALAADMVVVESNNNSNCMMDALQIGLESLVALVDPASCGPATAATAARLVAGNAPLMNAVWQHAASHEASAVSLRALRVLRGVWQDNDAATLTDIPPSVVPALMRVVSNHHARRPHHATVALQALHAAARAQPALWHRFRQGQGHDYDCAATTAVRSVHATARHAALARASQQVLVQVQG